MQWTVSTMLMVSDMKSSTASDTTEPVSESETKFGSAHTLCDYTFQPTIIVSLLYFICSEKANSKSL